MKDHQKLNTRDRRITNLQMSHRIVEYQRSLQNCLSKDTRLRDHRKKGNRELRTRCESYLYDISVNTRLITVINCARERGRFFLPRSAKVDQSHHCHRSPLSLLFYLRLFILPFLLLLLLPFLRCFIVIRERARERRLLYII